MVSNIAARLSVARAHLKENRLDAAEAEARAVLGFEPGLVPARLLLAVILLRTGRLDEADELLAGIRADQPYEPDAIGMQAFIRKAEGDFPGAIELYRKLTTLGHETPDLYAEIGACYLEIHDPVAAGAAFKKAIQLDRTRADLVHKLGLALKMAGNSFETFLTFKRAAELDPNLLDNYVELWQQMRQLLNWQEGLPLLEHGLKRHPDSTQLRVILASTYGKVQRPDKAEELFRAAAGADQAAALPYAHWLQEEGRFEDSIPVLQEAIRRDPIQGQPYYNLAVANCFEVDGEPLVDRAAALLKEESIGLEGRMFLHYAMAKSYDQLKDYVHAMASYNQANEHAFKLFDCKVEEDESAFDAELEVLRKLYSAESIQRLSPVGSKSEAPIFIVGMIRTGTTLLDQILSSHPQVNSAGEQPFWQVSSGRVNRRWLESGPTPGDIADLEKRYLEAIKSAGGGVARITDKMPTNFSHIGLMSVVFPNAKFVHTRRSPLDTCLSIYTTFLGRGTQFAYSKTNIVRYYRAYMRTMEHWRSALPPDRMIEIDYEDLVTNKEFVIREVLEFCGLEWDDACLSHEKNRSQVSTPSLWTARQPVNRASVERWRRYEPWLGTLLELKDLEHPARTRP